jgi:hypothetical protein
MLNPEAVFTLFFTDVLFGEQMKDPDFAAAIRELPVPVGGKIRSVIELTLKSNKIKPARPATRLGPKYNKLSQMAQVVPDKPCQSPYVHFAYTKAAGCDFSATEVSSIATMIFTTLSLNGVHDPALDDQLNMTDRRSTRPAPCPAKSPSRRSTWTASGATRR